jgi:luciferase family oxidoreductase group 1
MSWLSGTELVEGHPFRGVRAQPTGPGVPEVWVLGSSDYGAQVAAYFGLPYCFAHFITDGRGAAQAFAVYRDTYRPSERNPAPHAALTVWALAADTQEEAERLFLPRALWRLGRDRGVYAPLPSPEEAAAYPFTDADRVRIDAIRASALYGSADVVAAKLRAVGEAHGVDEIAILTATHDPRARVRSYELLAEAFELRTENVALAAE